jgi:hypothetical protein
MSNPLFLRLEHDRPHRVRIIGGPIMIFRRTMRDADGRMSFPLCRQEDVGHDGSPAYARGALKIIDWNDDTVKIMELPRGPMRTLDDHRNAVNRARRKHGRRNAFDPAGEPYGTEFLIFKTGKGIFTKYEVEPKMHRLLKADKELVKRQPLNLEEVYRQ